jgi:hypothetical protein
MLMKVIPWRDAAPADHKEAELIIGFGEVFVNALTSRRFVVTYGKGATIVSV